MNEGDVILTPIPQADGNTKNRPAVFLRELPPYGDMLICGVSTQLHRQVVDFDEVVGTEDADFASSGLKAASVIRLGFLSVVPTHRVVGAIGSISSERHGRLLKNLADYLLLQCMLQGT
jgi:mRNA interferase MazF